MSFKLVAIPTVLSFFFASLSVLAQKVDNNLSGYYKATSDTSLYSYFIFDNNGKVDIAGIGAGDYFTKGDSIILFPDKDVFKFKVEKDKITGVSDWVKGGVWIKQDTLVEDKRKDPALAQRTAVLLNEYYEKTRKNNDALQLLFDEVLFKKYSLTVEDLCNKGLPKACLEVFGLKLMKQVGGLNAVMNPQKSKTIKENPEMEALAHKIINMGEIDGYTVLGSYLYAIGKTKEGLAELEKASELGSKKAALTLLNLELAKMDLENDPQGGKVEK